MRNSPTSAARQIGGFARPRTNGVVGPERWTANTRGASVVLLLGRNAGGKSAVGELKSCWRTNSFICGFQTGLRWRRLRLVFEGFYSLPGSTLTCLRLNLIKFDDYLDTMARFI